MYPEATVNQSLLLLSLSRPSANFGFNRYQFWPGSQPQFRYPSDPYDRLWQRYGNNAAWTNITTTENMDVSNATTSLDKPTEILGSAVTPVNGTRIDFSWSSDPALDDGNSTHLLLLYFAELSMGSGQHTVSLVATPKATLPPILNAFEIYLVKPVTELGTNDADAKAMMMIRTTYALKKNWMGDPCAPKAFASDGLTCSYPSSGPAWITTLRLSSSGLTGAVDSSFGDLKSLENLDLSNNSLSGPVPDFLAQLPSLKVLDLSSNKLSGRIPAALLERHQNGSLELRCCSNARTGNNADLCDNEASTCELEKKSNKTLVIATVVPIALVATILFVAAFLILRRMRNRQDKWMATNSRLNSQEDRSNIFENRKFTYKELKVMTANFREEIGRGGEASAATPITWHQRLKIALDSAQDLDAKIADFGLMKTFADDEFKTHVTTMPAGTLGYLDPEYYNTSQLSEKSDVRSFGVVLLELITGQPPAVPVSDTESIHVALWVRQKLSEGDIASIADPRMRGKYDVNSVWKVAELALKCKEQPSRERPAMADIVAELKESLELQVSYAMGYYSSAPSSTLNLSATSVDLHSDAQLSDHPGKEALPEFQQVGIASATHIGPAQI
ncbi:putative LRR receptor-like serine/threonine-protein kinase [Panicum miliaceum]|uniref:non-specific serine/threonine protein kinase n=1 Tax=Panicum miliaceum TaxID=4540 RepID=A0A3L6T2A7_PANMI|nr:putative LRR receptor-like serine/threonine-protein kinase [Panicum miliaceum]